MKPIESQSGGGGLVGLVLLLGSQVEGDDRVDPNRESDGDRVDQILDGEQKGQGSHGAFADLCHKEAVDDVVEGGHHHGEDHGKGHGQHQGEHWLFFHKCLFHRSEERRVGKECG